MFASLGNRSPDVFVETQEESCARGAITKFEDAAPKCSSANVMANERGGCRFFVVVVRIDESRQLKITSGVRELGQVHQLDNYEWIAVESIIEGLVFFRITNQNSRIVFLIFSL